MQYDLDHVDVSSGRFDYIVTDWKHYSDHDGNHWWYNDSNLDFFFESEKSWTLYVDPSTHRPWWNNNQTGFFFFYSDVRCTALSLVYNSFIVGRAFSSIES